MTPDQHRRVSEVFLAAIRLDTDQRTAFVQSACGSDLGVRERVEAMLAQHDAPQANLESPVIAASLNLDALVVQAASSDSFAIPKTLGPYQITDVLGAGGMGVVYRAQQQTPKRTVALKAVRPGLISAKTLQRFSHEADILARLQHPGIAQIFEAGAESVENAPELTQPYFAMELVEGESLTDYAKAKGLSIRQRTALLADVSDAVHHAHIKGVIHRDLKPSNILVDQAGKPKVLDFGVARLTDPDAQVLTTQTDASRLIGTLAYMSPEQVSGGDFAVDTRCDVYALGVIGYELLTGKLPCDLRGRSIAEAARLIHETTPAPLGRHNPALRGDLETIIHKALEKNPDQRYPSAGELGADLRRYLADEPIVARPPTLGYQLRKFARRRRAGVAAGVAVCVALILGVAGIIRGSLVAGAQRDEAQRQFRIAQAVNDFLNYDLLALADPMAQPGHEITVKEALDRASESVATRFPEDDEVRAAIEFTLGRTYVALGEYVAAAPHLDEARRIRDLICEPDDPLVLEVRTVQAKLLQKMGQLDEADRLAEETLELYRRTLGDEHRDTLTAADALGMILIERGAFSQAESIYKEAIAILDRTAPEDELAIALRGNLADTYKWQGRLDLAEPLNEELVALARQSWGSDHPQTAMVINNLATLYLRQGRFEEARPLLEEAIDIAQPVLGDTHPEVLAMMGNLGTTLMNLSEYDAAAELLEVVYRRTSDTLGERNMDTVMTGQTLGAVYRYLHRYDEALALFNKTLESASAILGEKHPQTLYARSYIGLTLMDLEEFESAEATMRETLALYREALGETHPNTLHMHNDLARLLIRMDRSAEAESIYDDILAIPLGDAPHAAIMRSIFQTGYGRCLTAQQRYVEAETPLKEAREALNGTQWATSKYMRDTLEALVDLYAHWEKPDALKGAHELLHSIEVESN